jgi:hypothetical protein
LVKIEKGSVRVCTVCAGVCGRLPMTAALRHIDLPQGKDNITAVFLIRASGAGRGCPPRGRMRRNFFSGTCGGPCNAANSCGHRGGPRNAASSELPVVP